MKIHHITSQYLFVSILFCFCFLAGCSADHKDDKSVKLVLEEDFTNQLGMKMVKLSKGYWVSKYETTQEQFSKIMGYNPSWHLGDKKLPVERVSKKEAEIFCAKLTAYEKVLGLLPKGYSYRLPSFAEWKEYLSDSSLNGAIIGTVANGGRYKYKKKNQQLRVPWPVGSGEVNRLGIYDLRGNVAELSREDSKYSDAIGFGGHFSEGRDDYLKCYNKCYISWKDISTGFRCVLVKIEPEKIDNSSLHNKVWVYNNQTLQDILQRDKSEKVNIYGETALHTAVLAGNIEGAKLLLNSGFNVNAATNNNATPIHYASTIGNKNMVRLLLENEAKEPDELDNMSCMHLAVKSGNIEVIKLLVEHGFIDMTDDGVHGTALLMAMDYDMIDIASEILKGKVDYTIICQFKNTPLVFAAYAGWYEGVKRMLENGADPNLSSKSGHTALSGAKYKGHNDIVEILLEYGAKK